MSYLIDGDLLDGSLEFKRDLLFSDDYRESLDDWVLEDSLGENPQLFTPIPNPSPGCPVNMEIPKPGCFYRIQYGKGGLLTTTTKAYGPDLAPPNSQKRLDLARKINDHPYNRRFWIKGQWPFRDGQISFNPRFINGFNAQSKAIRKSLPGRSFAIIWIPPISSKPKPSLGQANEILFGDLQPDWSSPDKADLLLFFQNLLFQSCQRKGRPIVVGAEDDKEPVKNINSIPYRWVCKIYSVFLSNLGKVQSIGSASGFLLGKNRLVTSAHVLYKISRKTGLPQIPDSIFVVPGLSHPPAFLGDSAGLPHGVFWINRRSRAGQANFFVPKEWVKALNALKSSKPQFDYGVIDISEKKILLGKPPVDSWLSISPCLVTVGAQENEKSEELAKLVLKARGKGLLTAGYPTDEPCVPMEAKAFKFAGFRLPIDSENNFLSHAADITKGMSGSPVWLERSVRCKGSKKPRNQRILLGISQGGTGGQFNTNASIFVSHSTVITPRVFKQMRNFSLLHPL